MIEPIDKTVEAMETSLRPLVGLPLSDAWQPLWQDFEFGKQKSFVNRRGERATRARFSIGLFGQWRVTLGASIVLSKADHLGKRRFYRRKTAPRDPAQKARWQRANTFFDLVAEAQLKVETVEVDPTGAARITLTEGYRIEVIPMDSDPDDNVWTLWDHDQDMCVTVTAADMHRYQPDE